MTELLDAERVFALGPVAAVRAVHAALTAGLDPDGDMPRIITPVTNGQGC